MKLQDLASVELKLGVVCPSCGEIIAINGPRKIAKCSTCQATVTLEGELAWPKLLAARTPPIDVFKLAASLKEGASEEGDHGTVRLTVTRAWPKCVCGRRFEATKLAGSIAGGKASLGCPTCNVEIRVDRPSLPLRTAFPAFASLVGADVIPDGPQNTIPVKPRIKVPVKACGKCGTSLPLDGSTRDVSCVKCGVVTHLADEVWFVLHPEAQRVAWWGLFDRTRA